MDSLIDQAGIDVSLENLDVSVSGAQITRFANNPAGIRKMIPSLPAGCLVHLEATGGHERLVRRMLGAAGFEVRVHNPRKVRRLADARGVTAKTDGLDAKHLATSGMLLKPTCDKSAEREGLCDVSRAIQAIKSDIADHRKRLRTPELHPIAKLAYKNAARELQKQVKRLEKEFVKLVKQSSLAERYKLALTCYGVGEVLARTVVCELPEDLNEVDRRTVASYAGLAPINNDSGMGNKKAHIGRGNAHLKAALYMPAMSLISKPHWGKDHYARLRAKGREHQQAIVAVMRRLLAEVVAVLKRGTPWQAVPPVSP
jgi:transposase